MVKFNEMPVCTQHYNFVGGQGLSCPSGLNCHRIIGEKLLELASSSRTITLTLTLELVTASSNDVKCACDIRFSELLRF